MEWYIFFNMWRQSSERSHHNQNKTKLNQIPQSQGKKGKQSRNMKQNKIKKLLVLRHK